MPSDYSSQIPKHNLTTPSVPLSEQAAKSAPKEKAPSAPDNKYRLALKALDEQSAQAGKFDKSEYDKKATYTNLNDLSKSLAVVPPKIRDVGLRQAVGDAGRPGTRPGAILDAKNPFFNQPKIDARKIRSGLDRMRAMVFPAAAAEQKIADAKVALKAMPKLSEMEKERAKLLEEQVALLAKQKSNPAEFDIVDQQRKYDLPKEIKALDRDIKKADALNAVINEETAKLKEFEEDPLCASHYGSVQTSLDVISSDRRFTAKYNEANPGDKKSGIKGSINRGAKGANKSVQNTVIGLVTLTGSKWAAAIESQDKAQQLKNTEHELPTPAAKLLAASLMDSFDADAYSEGMSAAFSTTALPGAMALGPVMHGVGAPVTHAISQGLSHVPHHQVATEVAKEAFKEVKSLSKDAFIDVVVDESKPGHKDQVPMPTVSIKMTNGGVKSVDLTHKKTALALLQYLGPAIDEDRIKKNDPQEIARRDLRREMLLADPNDEEAQAALDKENFDGKPRSKDQVKFDQKLKAALFDPTYDNRDAILSKATPLQKLFAASGLI